MYKNTIDEASLIRYFSGEITGSDAKHIEEWISFSEENKELAKHIYYIYFASETVKTIEQTDSKKALLNLKKKMRRQKHIYRLKQVQRIAAIISIPLLLATIYLFINQFSSDNRYIEVRTNPGMVASIVLPDSSKIWLNSETYFKYPAKFTGKTREVVLDGEAFFDVERDVKRRFIVTTPKNVKVEVLGTEFNIEAYSKNKNVVTTLVAGKVDVSYLSDDSKVKHLVMMPNQRTIVNTIDNSVTTNIVNVEPDIAWKDGKIVFNNTSLEEALNILSKRFNVEFVIKNPKFKDFSFSGTFVHQRLDRILEHFKISSNINSKYIMTHENTGKAEKSIIEIY